MVVLSSISNLQRRCKEAHSGLIELIHKAALDITTDEKAWGQFLDYPQSNKQHGIYGTACAVKTLVTLGESASSDFVCKGLRWLRHSYEDASAKAQSKNDYALLYKYCFLLEALEPSNPEVSQDLEALFKQLLGRRLDSGGWGEYYFSDTHRAETADPVPTAIALYVLRRYVPFSGSDRCLTSLSWLQEKVVNGGPGMSPLQVALTAIVLDAYRKRHRELDEKMDVAADVLEKLVRKTRLGDWYPHHFSISNAETSDWTNKYIYFPTDAIIVTALIRSNHFWKARSFVTRSMRWYLDNMNENSGGFRQPQLRRISTVDQYWLGLAMQEFESMDAPGAIASFWRWAKARHLRFDLCVRLPFTLLAVGLYVWLTYFQLQTADFMKRAIIGTILMGISVWFTWIWRRHS